MLASVVRVVWCACAWIKPCAFAWTSLRVGIGTLFSSPAVLAPVGRSCPRSASSCDQIGLVGNGGEMDGSVTNERSAGDGVGWGG